MDWYVTYRYESSLLTRIGTDGKPILEDESIHILQLEVLFDLLDTAWESSEDHIKDAIKNLGQGEGLIVPLVINENVLHIYKASSEQLMDVINRYSTDQVKQKISETDGPLFAWRWSEDGYYGFDSVMTAAEFLETTWWTDGKSEDREIGARTTVGVIDLCPDCYGHPVGEMAYLSPSEIKQLFTDYIEFAEIGDMCEWENTSAGDINELIRVK